MTAVNNTYVATTSYTVENSSGIKYLAKFGTALTDLFNLTLGGGEQTGLLLSFFGTIDSTIGWLTDLPEAANACIEVYQPGERIVNGVDQVGRIKLRDERSDWKFCSKISLLVAKILEFGTKTASNFDLSFISNSIGNGCTFVVNYFDIKNLDFSLITQSAPVTFITNLGLKNITNCFAVFSFTCNIVELVGKLEKDEKGLTQEGAKKELHAKALACAGLVMEICKIAIISLFTFVAAVQGTYLIVGLNLTLSSTGLLKYMCGEKGPLNESFNSFVDWVVLT